MLVMCYLPVVYYQCLSSKVFHGPSLSDASHPLHSRVSISGQIPISSSLRRLRAALVAVQRLLAVLLITFFDMP